MGAGRVFDKDQSVAEDNQREIEILRLQAAEIAVLLQLGDLLPGDISRSLCSLFPRDSLWSVPHCNSNMVQYQADIKEGSRGGSDEGASIDIISYSDKGRKSEVPETIRSHEAWASSQVDRNSILMIITNFSIPQRMGFWGFGVLGF